MTARDELELGPARDARVERAGDRWTLILVRALRHPPEKVWRALTEPEYLREWAPFDADRSLGTAGATVRLTTVGAPQPQVTETTVARAEAPRLLEFRWGDGNLRWAVSALSAVADAKKDDPSVETELSEAMARLPEYREQARIRLEALAKRDLIASPEGYATLARLRAHAGDVTGEELALTRCKAMAKSAALCAATSESAS